MKIFCLIPIYEGIHGFKQNLRFQWETTPGNSINIIEIQ